MNKQIKEKQKGLKFKVKLQNANITSTFEITDKEKFLETWRNRGLLECVKPDGNIFSYELSKFYFMEIQELKFGSENEKL